MLSQTIITFRKCKGGGWGIEVQSKIMVAAEIEVAFRIGEIY